MEPIKINVNVELGPKTVDLLRAFLKPGHPAPAAAPVPAAGEPAPEPDMPDFTGDESPKEITDADLRVIVKEAKDRVGAKPVRAVFAEFGIASSVECPQERRSDLVVKLRNL